MVQSPAEQKVRAQLPFVRFLQLYVPLPAAQWLNQMGARRVRLEAGVRREPVSADGVPCEWIIPQDSPADRVLLYLHGGGFVFGVTAPHIQMVALLAEKIGIRALMVDYRLGPKHPFPAALDDCVTAYRWLLKQGVPARNLVIAGDSAGGNLTITTMMRLRDNGEPLPAAAACLSPVGDLAHTARGGSSVEFIDTLIPASVARRYNAAYVGKNDPCEPLISPILGEWHGLPPLLVHAGEDEFLCRDAVRIEQLARAAGIDVRLEIYPRMWHVWQVFLTLPQAKQSLEDIAQFLKAHLPE